MSLHTQITTLLMMFLSGQVLGVVFDMYRVISSQLKFHRLLIPMFDLLYWVASTWFVFTMLFMSNQGEVRFYIFLALASGAAVYYFLFSLSVQKLTMWLIGFVSNIIRILFRVLQLIIIRPIVWLYRIFMIFFGFLVTVAMFIGKFMLQLGYPFWRFFRWMATPIVSWPFLANGFRRGRQWIGKLKQWFKR